MAGTMPRTRTTQPQPRPRTLAPQPSRAGQPHARAQSRFGNAGTATLLARRTPTATIRRAPAPDASLSRDEEIRRSRTSPGAVGSGANPPFLTLSNYGIDIAQPKPEHRRAVDELVADLRKRRITPVAILVHGYADSTYTEVHNMGLSINRALVVRKLLSPLGSPTLPIGHGEDSPAVANDTAEHRNLNRRVVVTLLFANRPPPPPPPPRRDPEPFDLCRMVPWMCAPTKDEEEDNRRFCERHPWLCSGGIPFWPWLPMICLADPAECLALACLLHPSLCSGGGDPEHPERKRKRPEEDQCDRRELGRRLTACDRYERWLDRLCQGPIMTAMVSSVVPVRLAAVTGCDLLRRELLDCRSEARRSANCVPATTPPRCSPTGLTPSDAIRMIWYKPRVDDYYPREVVVANRLYDRDDPPSTLPLGEPIGVKEQYWPRPGKMMQLIPEPRGPGADRFRAILERYGFDWQGLQADHVQDIELGGPDEDGFVNLWPMSDSANLSAGSRTDQQQITFCEGPNDRGSIQGSFRALKRDHPTIYSRWFVIDLVTR